MCPATQPESSACRDGAWSRRPGFSSGSIRPFRSGALDALRFLESGAALREKTPFGYSRALPHFTDLVDLAAERLGGRVLFANDDFFAEKENLLKAEPAVFVPDRYTDRGKWMDGWESRRRRTPGHDY